MSQTSHEHAPGEVIDRHRHDYHQLIYVSAGVLAVQTDQGAWVASGGRAIWSPAQTWHEHRVYGHSSVHTVGFPVGSARTRSPCPRPAPSPPRTPSCSASSCGT
jgi:quercetin dioxygenase-like cupin family protein